MKKQINSLIINVATIPTFGPIKYPIGRGTITIDTNTITLTYISIVFFKKTRIIPFKDIDSYYRPFKTILYLDHHTKHCPKIVRLGNYVYDNEQVRDTESIIKSLKAHKIKARKNRQKIFGL